MRRKPFLIAAVLAAVSIPFFAEAQFTPDGAAGRMGHPHGMGLWGKSFAANPTIDADRTALDETFKQLRSDVKAGDSAAVIEDQAAIMSAVAHLQSDSTALMTAIAGNAAVQAAKAALKIDRLALERDRYQLRSDQIAGNAAGVTTDKQALAADGTKLRTDLKVLQDAIAAVSI